jgi:hypothetical protein
MIQPAWCKRTEHSRGVYQRVPVVISGDALWSDHEGTGGWSMVEK